MINIAINGFGRIGRTFLRTLLSDNKIQNKINIIAINIGPANPENIAYEFKYDSVMGTFTEDVKFVDGKLHIKDMKIEVLAEPDPKKLPWNKMNIDWVVEATGFFKSKEKASYHIEAGAKKVLITAPGTDEDVTIIPGINDSDYNKEKHNIVSLGSCTTNCFAPIIKVLKENFTLESGLMTTTHAYTNDQVLLDKEHKDLRRGRAAALNIIPTKTGADKVIVKIYPELKDKIQAISIRVPTPKVSLVDFTFQTKEKLTVEKINEVFEKASKTSLENILKFSNEPLVSCDYAGDSHSCIIDGLSTKTTGNLSKIFGWYDNEWGYSERLKDFLLHNS